MQLVDGKITVTHADLCAIAAQAAQGVQLEHAVWATDIPGATEAAIQAILSDPMVRMAYRVGESRWKAGLERAMTERAMDSEAGSIKANAVLLFALRTRCGYRPAGDDQIQSCAPVILVSQNKLAKVQEAKAAASASVNAGLGGNNARVEVEVTQAGPLPVVQGQPVVEQPKGKAQKRTAQRRRHREEAQGPKEPWELT